MLRLEPAWIARLGPEEIAEDLQIASCRTEAEFKAKRRAFARLNHPDLVHPDYREIATLRMMVANQLVDAALKRLERQA